MKGSTEDWHSELELPSASCPSCASQRVHCIGKIPSSFSIAGAVLERPLPGGRLFRCVECLLGFRAPRLPVEELNRYYLEAPADTWYGGGAIRKDWQLVAGLLTSRVNRGGAILDVGCGDGAFLDYIGDSWERYGIEINEKAGLEAEKRGVRVLGKDLYVDLAHPVGRYDVIVSLDVIEHVEDPFKFLERLRSLSKPQGVIIIATGNTDAPTWRFMGSRYWYCAMAEHISFINPGWCYLAARRLRMRLEKVVLYSHMGETGSMIRLREAANNIVYKFFPAVAAGARKLGAGRIDVSGKAELGEYPPSFASARDHMIALFQLSE